MDEPFSAEELEEMSGLQGIRDRVLAASGSKNPTVRDFIRISGRGRVHNAIVGGPKEVADRLEQWFSAPACDGFVLSATHVPGAYEDSCASSCRSCNGAGCFARNLPVSHCGRISDCRCRQSGRGARR